MYFEKKFCKNCNSELKIQNKRDVIRKNFCSRSCNGIFNGKKRLEDTDFKIDNLLIFADVDYWHNLPGGIRI
jgi:hypothetical protein